MEPCHGCTEAIRPFGGLANTGSALGVQVHLRSSAANRFFTGSNQYLARVGKIAINLPLDARIDHLLRPPAIRTSEARRRAEQAADQRGGGREPAAPHAPHSPP